LLEVNEELCMKDIPPIDSLLIKQLWTKFKDKMQLEEATLTTEANIQRAMTTLFDGLVKEISNKRDFPLQLHSNKPISDISKHQIDLSFTLQQDALNWSTLLFGIELENINTPDKEGKGQALSYLSRMTAARYREQRGSFGIFAFSNWRTITFLKLTTIEQVICYEGRSKVLFPNPLPDEPTEGFTSLIRILLARTQNLGLVSAPRNQITIKSNTINLTSRIHIGGCADVYTCTIDSKDCGMHIHL
jgi:hypothetical protein